jgi:hypothetical protein
MIEAFADMILLTISHGRLLRRQLNSDEAKDIVKAISNHCSALGAFLLSTSGSE